MFLLIGRAKRRAHGTAHRAAKPERSLDGPGVGFDEHRLVDGHEREMSLARFIGATVQCQTRGPGDRLWKKIRRDADDPSRSDGDHG